MHYRNPQICIERRRRRERYRAPAYIEKIDDIRASSRSAATASRIVPRRSFHEFRKEFLSPPWTGTDKERERAAPESR